MAFRLRTLESVLALAWTVLLAPLASARGTFVNPVAEGADPWVVRHDGAYYWCFSNANYGVVVQRSDRLRSLGHGRVVWTAPAKGPHSRQLWAPELHRSGDRWYIYVAASDGRNENHRMIVLESATSDPLSDFRFKAELYTGDDVAGRTNNRWAIDLSVFTWRGKLYGVWSGWETEADEQWLYAAEMSNPWTIATNRVRLCDNDDFVWERVDESIGSRGLNEAPQPLIREGRLFLVYSASGSWQPSYKHGMLELEPGADPLKPGAWKKHPKPVLAPTARTFGVGHCCFVRSPDGHEDWIVYHAKLLRTEGWDRALYQQPFTWTSDGRPEFGAPTDPGVPLRWPSGEIAPVMKVSEPWSAEFERGFEGWQAFGHQEFFETTPDGVRIGPPANWRYKSHRTGEKLLATDRVWSDATVRARMKVRRGGEAGLLFRVTAPALGRDGQQGYFVGLDAAEQRVRFVRFEGGADRASVQLVAVSHEIGAEKWHDVAVTAVADEFAVQIGGKVVLRAKDARWAQGTAGLRVEEGEAEFAGFAVEVVGKDVGAAARRD